MTGSPTWHPTRLVLAIVMCLWGLLALPVGATAAPGHGWSLEVPAAAVSGRPIVVAGRAPAARHASRVVLERRVGRRWRVLGAGKVQASRRFSVRFIVPTGATLIIRVRLLKGGRTLSISPTRRLTLGPPLAAPPSSPASPPAGAQSPLPEAAEVGGPGVVLPAAVSVRSAPAPGEDGIVTLDGPSNLRPGDYLAVGIGPATPNGFLGRVTAVDVRDGQTLASTTPAALTDIVPDGELDADFDDRAFGGTETTGRARRAAPAAPIKLTCSGGGSLNATASVSLTKHVSFTARWTRGRGVQATLKGDVTLAADVSASARASVGCSIPSTKILALAGAPVEFAVPIGPVVVPVVLTPNLNVYFDADASASGSLDTGIHVAAAATTGLTVTPAGVTPISGFEPSFTYTPPTLDGKGHIGANVTPTINVLVEGVAGPELAVKGGLAFDVDPAMTPIWALTAPVDLTAQLIVPALKLATAKLHVYQHTFALAPAPGWTPLAPNVNLREGCGIRTDGTLRCWGLSASDPQGNPPAGKFTQVTTGDWSYCALRSDATAVCWGVINDYDSRPAGTFTQLSVGGTDACGVRSNGSVDCWGSSVSVEHARPPGGTFTQISLAGAGSSDDDHGWFGGCGLRPDGHAVCWTFDSRDPAPTPPDGTFTQIAGSCGLRVDGTAVCWGHEPRAPDGTYTRIFVDYDAYGPATHCALRPDATAVCWGSDVLSGNTWTGTLPGGPFNQLSKFCGVRPDGSAICWGQWTHDGFTHVFPQPPAGHVF
jgi:hypothetical protein